MLRALLTPLSARLSTSNLPQTPLKSEDEIVSAEDFARDVLIEVMRNSVERLKEAPDASSKLKILTEIERIMQEDSCTKDAFVEFDGFLLLITALSTVNIGEPPVVDVVEQIRLIFMIMSESMKQYPHNADYFEQTVGYQPLFHALIPLVSNTLTQVHTLGYILSFALQDFSVSGYFQSSQEQPDSRISMPEHTLIIHRPGAIRVLWDFLPELDSIYRHAVLKMLEQLTSHCHRNQAVLSTLGIVSQLFKMFLECKDSHERSIIRRILRRALELGAYTSDTRDILRCVVNTDQSLNLDILELIRSATKARWPKHLSFVSPAALSFPSIHGLSSTGFTFMAWLWIENLPEESPQVIFGLRVDSDFIVCLSLRPDGKFTFKSTSSREACVFSSNILQSRWTHVALVHYTHRTTKPTIRLYIDGTLSDSVNWVYPKADYSAKTARYVIGDDSAAAQMRWCLASSHLISLPLDDNLFRLIHHLSPRYTSNFRSDELSKLLTYEASTSLNIFLFNTKTLTRSYPPELMRALTSGLDISEEFFTFTLIPDSLQKAIVEKPSLSNEVNVAVLGKTRSTWTRYGDITIVDAHCFDMSMWKLGGAAIALRLLQLANSPHEVSRALGILTDGLRHSWQLSEDMERLSGYDILCHLLRGKGHLINMTGFETLFEFLGLNFRSPDQSTIVNAVAYRTIALDFILWSKTEDEIQRAHLEHFTILLVTSKYKSFNVKRRLSKMGIVQKFLFVLQTDLYQADALPSLLGAFRSIVQAQVLLDETIKPILSMLGANLHDELTPAASPLSAISRIDHAHRREKAEHVLEILVSVLASSPERLGRTTATVPLTRICLLLLGKLPSPTVCSQVLRLIGISINSNHSFIKKFEVASGWAVLKAVLPYGWDSTVHKMVFDILLGRVDSDEQKNAREEIPVVICPDIMPAILTSLHRGLDLIATDFHFAPESGLDVNGSYALSRIKESDLEALIEELIRLHPVSPTFKNIFKSTQATQLFLTAYNSFISGVKSLPDIGQKVVGLMDKMSHFALALALDTAVNVSQQRELFTAIDEAQITLNPSARTTPIDPGLITKSIFSRRRISSGRLSLQLGDSSTRKAISRITDWRRTVVISERKRLRKTVVDLRENQRRVAGNTDWIKAVTNERSIWPHSSEHRLWRLDETEGPYRVRKKLEPDTEISIKKDRDNSAFKSENDFDVQSVVQVEDPPWIDSLDFSETEERWTDEVAEDKHRRVRHQLEPGDVIEAVITVARIVGVDSSPGLLIFGRSNLYFLDGLVENDTGEVIDARDAPKQLLFTPGSVVELNGPQGAHKWTYDQVINYTSRSFLFRDVGVEIYFRDSRSLLLIFREAKHRQSMHQKLSSVLAARKSTDPTTSILLKSPLLGRFSAIVLSGFRPDELLTAQKKWQAREISNFTYLSILNQLSGRTPSDATQYPVFPWVLQDYSSDGLDFKSPSSFRDLTRPMGTLTSSRREAAESRYSSLESVGEKPFHYGTHFSSSMIVCHFMIRLAPFTNMFKTLQGGNWDLPDRLFTDVKRAYESASQDIRGDVRELIPEFFTCPEFLENLANLDFGTPQNTKEKIHDVKLPPWAKQDPLLFVVMNRRALESDYVSRSIHEWIDLIWGYKQRDKSALNMFHPLSYEGSIDLDKIEDDLERAATVGIIHNFGQTPRKIFTTPHPPRLMQGVSTLPIGTFYGIEENFEQLEQNQVEAQDLGLNTPVGYIGGDHIDEKIVAYPECILPVPSFPHEQVEWFANTSHGIKTGELRVSVHRKIVQIVESAFCICGAFADSDSMATGSDDRTIRLWRLTRTNHSPLRISLSHIMRGHQAPVVCVAASRAWSIVVSGSKDGSAIVWDLNRGVYVASIWHGKDEVYLAAVNESTGYIATCSREKLCLHTVNARQITTLDLTISSIHAPITSLAFHEREYSHLGVLATGSSDGTIALRTWNADNTPTGQRAKWEFQTLRELLVRKMGAGRGQDIVVTALKFVGECLHHGQNDGKVYSWNLHS